VRVVSDPRRSAKMILRLLSIWICVLTAGVVSFFSYGISRWVEYPLRKMYGTGKALPHISEWFYPPSFWPYLFFIPFIIWAISLSIRSEKKPDEITLIITTALSSTFIYLVISLLSILLPLCLMLIGLLHSK